jgi:tetratricopeptide (TPR) repeat protein
VAAGVTFHQAAYGDAQRLADCLAALELDPSDLLSRKGAALALVQRAMATRAAHEPNRRRQRESESKSSADADLRAALAHLAAASALAPAHPEVCMVYAEVLHLAGQPAAAAAAVAKCAALYRAPAAAVASATHDASSSGTSSGSFAKGGDEGQLDGPALDAAADADAALLAAPGAPVPAAAAALSRAARAAAHLNFGRGFLAVGRPRDALRELAAALALAPTLAGAHHASGDARALLGEWPAAAACLARAAALRPRDAPLRRDLDRARQRAAGLRG